MDGQTPTPEPVKRTREFDLPSSLTHRPSILVVDDDLDTCDVIQEVLNESGFRSRFALNGEAALRHLERHPETAAVVLDLMMPIMNGWTFVDRIRARPLLRDVPIVVITASAPHWGYPVTQVLRKPVGKHELLAAVRAAISHPHNNQANG
jgi:CheY-like chemotaxis protein